ncbi:hypothetical protein OKA04_08280 [Luteolibacter flavescens]|uniref:Uncharacterized protein n=1 Tax=Luteolibacter flavescens TaxID=1859460 RepID=A0ABT3FMP2_9BACT|nr:hypothetical protein [Luteolibacter flavescens]MCW1884722.1 hypothetical protein [Luteolibacter flavescens]
MSSTPETPLQFDCPACGAVLTVPASIAGMQGPCPKCWQEIISPDPARGQVARLPALPVVETPVPATEELAPVAAPAPQAELPVAPVPVPVAAPDPLPAPAFPPLAADTRPSPWGEPAPAPATPPLPPAKEEAADSDDFESELPPLPPRRKSRAGLFAAIGLFALALAGVGFYFAKDLQPHLLQTPSPDAVNRPPNPAPKPEPTAEVAPAPVETDSGQLPPPAPEASEAHDAQEALIAFLGAPDWQARSAYVLYPEETRPEMEKHAKENGDGPIPASAVSLDQAASAPPTFFSFKVSTKAMPDGFPVLVVFTDEGPKVYWESFTGFNDDHFRKLLVGPPEKAAILNLLVKPEHGEEPSPHWVRYRLSVPMPGRQTTAWVRKDSVALAGLRAVFEGSNGFDKDTIGHQVAGDGVPLRLGLIKRRTNDGREFIEVTDLVAIGWAPPKQ